MSISSSSMPCWVRLRPRLSDGCRRLPGIGAPIAASKARHDALMVRQLCIAGHLGGEQFDEPSIAEMCICPSRDGNSVQTTIAVASGGGQSRRRLVPYGCRRQDAEPLIPNCV